MKEWSDIHIFSYPWALMVEAAYRKYPNPHNPNVKSLDTLERRYTPGRLFSHRLFCTMWSVPPLVLKIIGSTSVMRIHEQSVCDLESKTLTICARNITLSNLFTMDETLVYAMNPKDPNTTLLRQTATMRVFGVPLLGGVLEDMLVSRSHGTSSYMAWGRGYPSPECVVSRHYRVFFLLQGRLGVEVVAEQVRTEHKQPA